MTDLIIQNSYVPTKVTLLNIIVEFYINLGKNTSRLSNVPNLIRDGVSCWTQYLPKTNQFIWGMETKDFLFHKIRSHLLYRKYFHFTILNYQEYYRVRDCMMNKNILKVCASFTCYLLYNIFNSVPMDDFQIILIVF